MLTTLSSAVAGDAVMSKNLHEKQTNFTNFLEATTSIISKKRGENFAQKPVAEKVSIDRDILAVVESSFKEIIFDDPQAQLNPDDLKTISRTISSFCESFYATD